MKKILTFFASLLYLFIPLTAYAAPPRIDGLTAIFDRAMDMVLPLGGLIALGMMVFGGYMWMMSEGDPGKVKRAQGILTWAIIGLIFLGVFGALLSAIINFIES